MSDSIVMTMGQFRRIIRESAGDCYQYWDPFDFDSRRYAAERLIARSKPDSMDKSTWEELLYDYVVATSGTEPHSTPGLIKALTDDLPEGINFDEFEAMAKEARSGEVGDNSLILRTAVANVLGARYNPAK